MALALNGGHRSVQSCYVQSFYLTAAIAASAWMNSVVSLRIFRILRETQQCQRVYPTTKQVVVDAALCYCWGIFVGCLVFIRHESFPFQTGQINGLVCLPYVPGDDAIPDLLFFLCAYLPALGIIPQVFATYLALIVWKRGLLPYHGQTRQLFIFFYRIIFVFLIVWLPTVVSVSTSPEKIPLHVMFAFSIWNHMQCVICAAVALTKPDIRSAYRDFMYCRTRHRNQRSTARQPRRRTGSLIALDGGSSYLNPDTNVIIEMSSRDLTHSDRPSETRNSHSERNSDTSRFRSTLPSPQLAYLRAYDSDGEQEASQDDETTEFQDAFAESNDDEQEANQDDEVAEYQEAGADSDGDDDEQKASQDNEITEFHEAGAASISVELATEEDVCHEERKEDVSV